MAAASQPTAAFRSRHARRTSSFTNGRPLDFRQPTPLTGAELLSILPDIRADLLGALNPGNRDFTLRNINRSKEGANLDDPSSKLPSAIHVGLGIQRELAGNFIVSGDVVWRGFDHTFITGIDFNRFNSAQGPALRVCGEGERDDVQALCSNGPIRFDTTVGRARCQGRRKAGSGTRSIAGLVRPW